MPPDLRPRRHFLVTKTRGPRQAGWIQLWELGLATFDDRRRFVTAAEHGIFLVVGTWANNNSSKSSSNLAPDKQLVELG